LIITPPHELFFFDFGLICPDVGIEEKAMDIHLFYRVVRSSHGEHYEVMIHPFLSGYQKNYQGNFSKIMERVQNIGLRGRYIAKSLRKGTKNKSYRNKSK
ncbi:MAG: hypothetical protein ACTSUK_08880, partial [Promethearchaeota archaeon]